MERYVCVHGHFYQPPRENPWLDAIEVQDSAYPYHDWNERIAAECYGPNGRSRILGGDGFIDRIVNNYSRISFNFGPTLLSWLERNLPDVYAHIREADEESQLRFGGHGSAMAQVHSHIIMPLANERDKHTQVVWGIKDFEYRFGRKPEGMWLAETAVDTPTLEALAAEGIAFTVLAPRQAAKVQHLDSEEWQDVDSESLDTTRAYRVDLPSGRTISLFFYDGPLSQAVAFEGLLGNGAEFARRLAESVQPDEDSAPLAHIATDGESYGHHHRYGDMALAYALDTIQTTGTAKLTNYAEYLERFPPTDAVEIHEASSWSCAHGVERWRSDCGCNSGGHRGWNQAWRKPLREGLDELRDDLARRFEEASLGLLRDPWEARNDYLDVTLDSSGERLADFMRKHTTIQGEDGHAVTKALKLLEMQRQAVLMFASCAWFYDDISGIESVQGLLHAGRAIQLAEELFGPGIEAPFLAKLAEAKSNLPDQVDGATSYRRYVLGARVDLQAVAAHFAVSSLFSEQEDHTRIGPYVVHRSDFRLMEAGKTKLAYGQAVVTCETTRESDTYNFVALHLGDQNIAGGVLRAEDVAAFESAVTAIAAAFDQGDQTGAIRLIDVHFSDQGFSLRSLFRDEQRRTVGLILAPALDAAEQSYRSLYEEQAPLIRFLAGIGYPIPNRLRTAAQFALDIALRRAVSQPEVDAERARLILDEARVAGVRLESETLQMIVRRRIEELAAAFYELPEQPETLARLRVLAELLPYLGLDIELWRTQNLFYDAVEVLRQAGIVTPEARADLEAVGQALRVRVHL